ncbi:MAG: hypothetical protein JSR85_04150 [Proteobacteria bacterium]|nr:hypothetical protein [Pseudomonadota bacterium]
MLFILITFAGIHEAFSESYTCGCLGLRHCWDDQCQNLYNTSCDNLTEAEEQNALLSCTQNQSLMCCTAGQWMGMYGCPVMWTTRYTMGDPQECGPGTLSKTEKDSSQGTKTIRKK